MLAHLESAWVWLNLPVQTECTGAQFQYPHPPCFLPWSGNTLPTFVLCGCTPRTHYCTICQEARGGGQVSDRFV